MIEIYYVALFNPSYFFYQFKIGLSILERIWADCQAIIVCFVSKQIWMRSLLVQSYCNRCVSEEVNLPTVSLLSRACLFKILYLSAKRNVHVLFFYLFFPKRSFPLNDVHAFQEIFFKKCILIIFNVKFMQKKEHNKAFS